MSSAFWDNMTAERPINRRFITHEEREKNYESRINALEYQVQQLKGENYRLREQLFKHQQEVSAALTPSAGMSDILDSVCGYCDMTADEITSPSRLRKYVRARVIFMVKARMHGHSLKAIGWFLKRDHSTVIHAMDNKFKHLDDMDIQFTQL